MNKKTTFSYKMYEIFTFRTYLHGTALHAYSTITVNTLDVILIRANGTNSTFLHVTYRFQELFSIVATLFCNAHKSAKSHANFSSTFVDYFFD